MSALEFSYGLTHNFDDLNRQIFSLVEELRVKFTEMVDKEVTDHIEKEVSLIADIDTGAGTVKASKSLIKSIEGSDIHLGGAQLTLTGQTIMDSTFSISGSKIASRSITCDKIATGTITKNELNMTSVLSGISLQSLANNTSSYTNFPGGVKAEDIKVKNLRAYSSTIYIQDSIQFNYRVLGYGIASVTTSSSPNVCCVSSDGDQLEVSSQSSKRFKHDIKEIGDNLSPEKLYDIPVKQFIYNDDYLSKKDQRSGKEIPGFIAEDIKDIYPIACDLDGEGNALNWNVRYIVPPMLKLIQDLNGRISKLEEKDG